eukprot:447966-Rhodomonas_salina.2
MASLRAGETGVDREAFEVMLPGLSLMAASSVFLVVSPTVSGAVLWISFLTLGEVSLPLPPPCSAMQQRGLVKPWMSTGWNRTGERALESQASGSRKGSNVAVARRSGRPDGWRGLWSSRRVGAKACSWRSPRSRIWSSPGPRSSSSGGSTRASTPTAATAATTSDTSAPCPWPTAPAPRPTAPAPPSMTRPSPTVPPPVFSAQAAPSPPLAHPRLGPRS